MIKRNICKLNDRNEVIDYIKGLAIYLVILGHCIQCYCIDTQFYKSSYLYLLIYSFHMPLFIFISGYLFQGTLGRREDLNSIIKRKSIQLLYPYLIFGFVYFLVHKCIIGGELSFYWFLTSLWICIVLTILIKLVEKKYNELSSGYVFFLVALVWFLTGIRDRDVWMYIFFLLGLFCNKILIGKISKLSFVFYFITTYLLYILCPITINDIQYRSGLETFTQLDALIRNIKFLLRACIMIALIYKISLWTKSRANRLVSIFLIYAGKNSLLLYLLQKLFVEEVGYYLIKSNILSDVLKELTYIDYNLIMITYSFVAFYILTIASYMINKSKKIRGILLGSKFL